MIKIGKYCWDLETRRKVRKENDIIDKSLSIHASFRLVLGQKGAKESFTCFALDLR